jgi:hypothetical protein
MRRGHHSDRACKRHQGRWPGMTILSPEIHYPLIFSLGTHAERFGDGPGNGISPETGHFPTIISSCQRGFIIYKKQFATLLGALYL